MNSNTAIRAVNISKQYRLGEVGTGTLSHDLNRYWAKLRGKEDPYLKIGEANDRTQKGESEYVWALQDINFEIEKGDAVGIIGRNGAGKSTLLKLLSRVTQPTTGYFELQGRIASLLEVGTGFNPEMTGRENIFLNGAILGMRRKEIKRKFDEIVDFAGVERYIDTPVKRYSSGMYVRLAFAVAAHLESEILIVDEVLSVGDTEFQKKCLGKMDEVSKGEGRTVLFVSHNMASVKALCEKGIMLDNGKIFFQDKIDSVIQQYEERNIENIYSESGDINLMKRPRFELGTELRFIDSKILNSEDKETNQLKYAEPFSIELNLKATQDIGNVQLGIRFETASDTYIASCLSSDSNKFFDIEKTDKPKVIKVTLKDFNLTPGIYYITLSARKGKVFYDQVVKAVKFEVLDYSNDKEIIFNNAWGLVKVESQWQ